MSGGPSDASADLRRYAALAVPVVLVGALALDDGGIEQQSRQLAALIIAWGLALAFAFGALPRALPPPGWRLAAGGLVGLAALQLLAVAWGPSDERAIEEALRTIGYLALAGLAWTGLGPGSWRLAARGLFVIAVAVTAYAMLGRLVPSLAGLDELERSFGTDRLFAPLGYWNALGAWAAITVAMGLAWSADARDWRMRALTLALVPLAGTVVYLTYSRGAVVAVAIGVGLVLTLTRNRRRATVHALAAAAATTLPILSIRGEPEIANATGGDGGAAVALVLSGAMAACSAAASRTRSVGRRNGSSPPPRWVPRAAGAGAVIAVVGLVLVALVGGTDGFGRGAEGGSIAAEDPASRLTRASGNRSALWSEAIDGWRAHPWHGEGPGAFEWRWAREGTGDELVVDAHSIVFETTAELGLLGLLALAMLLIGLTAAALRGLAAANRNAAAISLFAGFVVFVFAATIDWMWESTALAYLGLGSGLTLAMAASKRLGRGAKAALGRRRWALVAAAVVIGATQVPGIVSTDLVREADEQIALGAPDAAIRFADDAITATPWAATPYAVRAEAELEAGRLAAAASDAARAVAREPREAAHHFLLARVEAARGNVEAAESALRAAQGLSPRSRLLRGSLAIDLAAELRLLHQRSERHSGPPGIR